MPDSTCPECGENIHRTHTRGPLPRYCSRSCKEKRYYRETVKPGFAPRLCQRPGCLELVGSKKWCDEHRRARAAEKAAEYRLSRTATCSSLDCGHIAVGRGLCSTHYSHYLRDLGRLAPQEWNDTRKRNHQARRARKKGVTVEPVSLARVAERDGFMCGICETRVDMDLVYPDPFSQSLDHVLPLSKGGEHSYANTQLAHLRCNVSKGDRVLVSA